MNILFVNRDMGLGGGNTFLRSVGPALRARGHRVYLVSASGEVRCQMEAAFDGVFIHALRYPWESMWLRRLIRKLGVDVVMPMMPVQFHVTAKACFSTGAALVLNLNAPFKASRVCRYLGQARAITVMNEYQRRYYANLGADAQRITRLYWMVDWDHFEECAKPFAERPPNIAYCSRLSGTKAPLAVAFVEAAQALRSEVPDLRVQIVGRGSHLRQVQEAVQRRNAEIGAPFAGVLADVLDTAPIFGSCRLVAGGNYACIEALAAGAHAVGAGYDGVYGLVTAQNLEEAAEQYFGDHMTPITGVDRDERLLVGHFTQALRAALTEPRPPDPVLLTNARRLFRREEAVLPLERVFADACGASLE
ncbi:MAG: glycosyltransferase [Chthonomonadales bacterium]